jgi:hypothetical protein
LFKATLGSAHAYEHGTERPEPEKDDPSRSNLDRGASRLDLVDMLLLRRRFAADRSIDRVQSIHLYSDASPVTGEELQGMIMDVFYRGGEHERIVLPGVTLAYGSFNAIVKATAILWAAWLIAGPEESGVRYFMGKVFSLVTDHGTEIKMITVPDIISAFMRWNEGWELPRCAPLVVFTERLFNNAIRISGWCHAWGNLMQEVAHVCPCWPRILDQLRTMV